jgi:hypothetical protein
MERVPHYPIGGKLTLPGTPSFPVTEQHCGLFARLRNFNCGTQGRDKRQ